MFYHEFWGRKEKRQKKHALRFYGPILSSDMALKKFDFFRRMNFWSNKPKVVTRARKREREKERKKERKKEKTKERKKRVCSRLVSFVEESAYERAQM